MSEGKEAPPAQEPNHSVARSAGLIGIATLTSRILGLGRDQALAFFFGAGNAMDAFNVAFRIPNLVRDLFAEGAMSAAFVPTFTRYLTLKGKEEAWRLGNHVINGLIAATGLLVILGVIFAEPLVNLIAPDYAKVGGKLELTVELTRIMLPFLTLVAVAVAVMGMLNSLHRFFVPALSPAMFNVATILCALGLVPVMPSLGLDPIKAIAFGTILGGLGQILIQWPVLRRQGFRYRPILNPRDEGLRHVLLLMVPGTVGLAAVQVNLLVSTMLATGQGEGAVSWLNYAFRLMYLPIGLLGVSVATVAIPEISRFAAREDLPGMRASISRGLRLMLVLNIPAMVGLMVLARPIVALIFEHGRFGPDDTEATSMALIFYAPGLMGYSAVKIAAPSFYALKESRTPVVVSVLTMGVNVALNLTFVHWLGYRGLALGTGLAALFNATLLLTLLARRLDGIAGRELAVVLAKVLVGSAIMGAAAAGAEAGLERLLPGKGALLEALRVGAAIFTGTAVFAAASRALRIEEFQDALGILGRRLSRLRGKA
jgi:putative peptidoglycan lipid II flippase